LEAFLQVSEVQKELMPKNTDKKDNSSSNDTTPVTRTKLLHPLLAAIILYVVGVLPIHSNAQESESSIMLVSSDAKISLSRHIGLGPPDNQPLYFTLIIVNDSNETATGIKSLPSSLTENERGKFSFAPSYIGYDKIKVSIPQTHLNKDEQMKITYNVSQTAIDEIGSNEVVYGGRLTIVGDNFEPIVIDVELKFTDNPWIYFIIAWIGVAVAIIVGYIYSWLGSRDKIKRGLEDDGEIIDHINEHIQSFNIFRNIITSGSWDNIYDAYRQKRMIIIQKRNNIELEPDLEAVKWFEQMDDLIREKRSLENPILIPPPQNRLLRTIDKLNIKDRYYQVVKKRKMKELLKASELANRRKWIYGIGTLFVASIVSVAASAFLMGNAYISAIIAISIGFMTYRAQDLIKVINPNAE
jgi:hypothetical protein